MGLNVRAVSLTALIGLAAAVPAMAAKQDSATSRSAYTVRFLGLPIARAAFETTTTGDRYVIEGTLDSAGIASLFKSVHGKTHVAGTVEPDRLQASSYVVDYMSGKKKERTEITYRHGNVTAARQMPKPKKRGKNWVPVANNDLKSVVDPISSLVLPAGEPACPRTVAVFDGETRADLELVRKGRQPFTTQGFSGRTTVCSVRFVPRAGYRKGNDSIDYLRRSTGIEIWFARTSKGGFYAPVYARIPTRIGSVTVSATRFGR